MASDTAFSTCPEEKSQQKWGSKLPAWYPMKEPKKTRPTTNYDPRFLVPEQPEQFGDLMEEDQVTANQLSCTGYS